MQPPVLRRWHRWASIPAAVFLLFIAVTGVLSHLELIRTGNSPPASPPQLVETEPLPSNEELERMVRMIAEAAREEPDLLVNNVQLDFSAPQPVLIAGQGGPPGTPRLRINATTGERMAEPPPKDDYHYILQDLHAGYAFGWTGRIISMLSGLALLILCITGLQVWWGMYRRMRKGPYWK